MAVLYFIFRANCSSPAFLFCDGDKTVQFGLEPMNSLQGRIEKLDWRNRPFKQEWRQFRNGSRDEFFRHRADQRAEKVMAGSISPRSRERSDFESSRIALTSAAVGSIHRSSNLVPVKLDIDSSTSPTLVSWATNRGWARSTARPRRRLGSTLCD